MIDCQLPFFPVYRVDGETFPTLRTAAQALGRVTVRRGYSLVRRPLSPDRFPLFARRSEKIRKGTYSRATLFREIDVVLTPASPEIEALYPKGAGDAPIRPEAHAELGLAALTAHLERSWNPDARHVVFHSSGYDSRLLAALLRRIADRRGEAWLGDVRLICFQPEIKEASALVRHLGWNQTTWCPIDPAADPEDYYAECLDATHMGAHLSDTERLWGGALLTQLRLDETYLATTEPKQGLSAALSDETSKWNRLRWGDLGWFLGCYHFDQPGILPGRPDVEFILPFGSVEWLTHVSTYRLPDLEKYPPRVRRRLARHAGKPGAIDASKQMLLELVDPALADLPNWRFQARHVRARNTTAAIPKGYLDQQRISARTAQAIEGAYGASWYAREMGPATLGYEGRRHLIYDAFEDAAVGHILAAAICQQLLREGIQLAR